MQDLIKFWLNHLDNIKNLVSNCYIICDQIIATNYSKSNLKKPIIKPSNISITRSFSF